MACVNSSSISAQRFVVLGKPTTINDNKKPKNTNNLLFQVKGRKGLISKRRRNWSIVRSSASYTEEELIPVRISSSNDSVERRQGEEEVIIGGFSFEGEVVNGSGSVLELERVVEEEEDFDTLVDRAINATILLAAASFALSKLLTIDKDYWHGWTVYEILIYAPLHNWAAYEEALKENPVFAKMVISGVVYSIGDWIAQCYEGKPLFDFDRTRMFRSGLVGFSLHGSLSHYYYQFCEALFPFQDWWVVPVKVAFDQTAWAALWNSIYFVVLGFLRFESPVSIFTELKATFFPMLTAGWKLWPFAHLITYGVVPIEQRLLWVDCVELIWVTILSTLSNEKSEARSSELSLETNHIPIPITSEDQVKSTENDQL